VAQVGIEPTLFNTLGVPITRGRTFDQSELDAHAPVSVLSETAAAMLGPNVDPLGARLTISTASGTSTSTVVGIARDAIDAAGMIRAGLMAPDVYVPLDIKRTTESVVLARTNVDPHTLLKAIGTAARPSPSSAPLEAQIMRTSIVHEDSVFVIRFFGGFALLALLLAGTGIYGVISQSVAQRTTEFGVRLAIGATPGQVLRTVLAREAKLIAAAVGVAVVGTVLVTHSAFAEMLALAGSDARTWLIVSALCGGMSSIAVAFATWRIVKLDPWTVLRST
jgi:putative ABC transport system permease protein